MYLLHRGKSGESILKHVEPEWVVGAHVHIHTHVKLTVVDQIWASQIPVHKQTKYFNRQVTEEKNQCVE